MIMKNGGRPTLRPGLLVLAVLPLILTAQFRLDQFTHADPNRSVLQQSDGSVVWAMTPGDSTVLWKGDANGLPQWTMLVSDPGDRMMLMEGPNGTIDLIEAKLPISVLVSPFEVHVTQQWRATRISGAGGVQWSKEFTISYANPDNLNVIGISLQACSTANGGLVASLMNSSNFGNITHIARLDANGNMAWCRRYGADVNGIIMLPGGQSGMENTMLVQELPGGHIAVTPRTSEFLSDVDIQLIDAAGNPLSARKVDYVGGIIFRRVSALALSATGNLLVGGRMSTAMSANIFTYEVDGNLELVDKDLYWGFGATASSEFTGFAVRADNERILQVNSAAMSSNPFTYLIAVDGNGNVDNTLFSDVLPYTSGQSLVIKPKHLLFADSGVYLAHSVGITHPALGNIGHFLEQSFEDLSEPGCYFSASSVEHAQIPDSLVEELPLDPFVWSDAAVTGLDASPLAPLPLIGMTQGCLLETGIENEKPQASFQMNPSTLIPGGTMTIRITEAMDLWVVDQQGRVASTITRTYGPGAYALELMLAPGLYIMIGESRAGALRHAQRFVVQ